MNDIKIGDYLLCKEDFYNKEELIFKKDKCYQIYEFEVHVSGHAATVRLETTLFWYQHDMITKHPGYKEWYIWTYFYTPAELRQKQIDSVIDGNI